MTFYWYFEQGLVITLCDHHTSAGKSISVTLTNECPRTHMQNISSHKR